jgi:hypothetical protein
MKRLALLIAGFCLFAGGLRAQPPQSPSKSVSVLGTALILKDEKRTADQYLAEYIPEAESFDNFTKMFAVWGRLDGSDAQAQVKAKIQFVTARKASDPMANYNAFQSEDKKAYGLDFLISEGAVMEHNVWSFQNVKGGVLAYQYARRHYDGKSSQSAADFIREIPSVRNQVLGAFKSTSLPRPPGYVLADQSSLK